MGLTSTATLIAAAREEAGAQGITTLLFDNGDSMQGAPLGDMASRDDTGRPHPLMRAFAHLGYDAAGLGNHDFNYGLDALGTALAQSPCPVICTNLRAIGDKAPREVLPFAVLERTVTTVRGDAPIRIGLLSFVPPQTRQWDAHLLTGQVELDDIIDSARTWLPELQKADCDLVIALAHSGLDGRAPEPGMENAVIPLAALDGIDAIIGGHTHTCLPGPQRHPFQNVDSETGKVHGKPVVMAGASGSHLGVIDLTLIADESGHWTVSDSRCGLRPIARRNEGGQFETISGEDPDLVALLAADHDRALEFMEQPVGHSDVSLHSYFTFVSPSRALAMVAAAQAAAVQAHLRGSFAEDLPLLSAVAPGKFGARAGPRSFTDIPAGTLTLRHLSDLHLFPDELLVVMATGAQLIDWLERSASLFHRVTAGAQEAVLIDPDSAGHDFDVIYGLTYLIDLTREARFQPDGKLRDAQNRRIQSVRHNGFPIDPDQLFTVAVNSFRAGGGGNFRALNEVRRIDLPPIAVRDALRDYVGGKLRFDPLRNAPSPWGFVPMPDTRVALRTGPGASAHLDELADRDVRTHGTDESGFLKISLQP